MDEKTKIRNALILRYLPLVKVTAKLMRPSRFGGITEGDLVSFGVFGLMDAIKKFDKHRGVKFETYARHSIKGSMRDGIRDSSFFPNDLKYFKRKKYEKERENSFIDVGFSVDRIGRSIRGQRFCCRYWSNSMDANLDSIGAINGAWFSHVLRRSGANEKRCGHHDA